MSAHKTAPALSLADDLHEADTLLIPLCVRPGRAVPLVLRLLVAIWLAIERLRQAVQASAAAGTWGASEFASKAKGGELGIEARPGESQADYCARIAAVLKEQGRA